MTRLRIFVCRLSALFRSRRMDREIELVESYLKANSLTALYDSVFIPVLTAAETDARAELLDEEQLINVEQSMRDIIEDLGTRPAVPSKAALEKVEAAADEEAPAPPALAPD